MFTYQRPTRRRQHQNRNTAPGQILLRKEVAVGRDEEIELAFSRRKELTVTQRRPAELVRRCNLVAGKNRSEWGRGPLIEEDPHVGRDWTSVKLFAACSSTDSTCWRVTPGNHRRNSSTVAPPSRFSNNALTGTLVPLKLHVPLSLSGFSSTASHLAQSSMPRLYRRVTGRTREPVRSCCYTPIRWS